MSSDKHNQSLGLDNEKPANHKSRKKWSLESMRHRDISYGNCKEKAEKFNNNPNMFRKSVNHNSRVEQCPDVATYICPSHKYSNSCS